MSRSAWRLPAILSLLVLTHLGWAQATNPAPPPTGNTLSAETKAQIMGEVEKIVTTRAFVPGVDFSKWPGFVEKRKDEIEKATTETDFTRVLNTVLRDFGISHIRFRTPRAAQQRTSGTTTGLGMQVKKVDAGLEVVNVIAAGPAGQAGLEIGDIIKEVEKQPASDPSAIQIEVGKSIGVTILKKSGETRQVTLENKPYTNRRPETLTWIGEDAAVLRVYTFSTGYDRKNIEKLVDEANKRAKYLVLDLRSNGGGAVSNLNHLLSLLMPNDTAIGTFVSRTVADAYAKEKGAPASDPIAVAAWAPRKFKTVKRDIEPFTGRVAVLINRGSASASEIAGAALRDCRDAVILGQPSRGAVLASTYGRLPAGFEIQFPVQDYVTIKGIRLEGNPLKPDIELARDPDGTDSGPARAIEALQKKEQDHTNSPPSRGDGHRLAA